MIDHRVPGLYMTMKHDGRTWHDYVSFIVRKSDMHHVYCIEPGVTINSSVKYVGTDDLSSITNFSEDQLTRVSLLAYYGYRYANHLDEKWYAVTQYLIWQTIGEDWQFYFTNGLAGKELPNQFSAEMKELEELVADHYEVPDFGSYEFNLLLGSSLELIDELMVLNNFKIISETELLVNDNTLTFIANQVGQFKIRFIKEEPMFTNNPIVYYNDNHQNVFMVGNYLPVSHEIIINVTKPLLKVPIPKTGKVVFPWHDLLLGGLSIVWWLKK